MKKIICSMLLLFIYGSNLVAQTDATKGASLISQGFKNQSSRALLYVGGAAILPLSNAKSQASLTNSFGLNVNGYLPLASKSIIDFGLNIDAGFSISTGRPTTVLPPLFNIASQTSATSVYRGSDPKNFGFKTGLGPQLNITPIKGFMISTILNIGFLSVGQRAYDVAQTTQIKGQQYEFITAKVKENTSGGFAVMPKLRFAYMFSNNIGVWTEACYSWTKQVQTNTEIMVPDGNADREGNYNLLQLQNVEYKALEPIKVGYRALGVNAGLVIAIGKRCEDRPKMGWDGGAENKTKMNKANVNRSRSNIKQQIDGRPVTNDSTSTEPAKANINRSRSNIKQQIDGRPVKNDSTITEPAKANINKSRSNIKQQIDGRPVTNDSTSTLPAKANINRSRSNIKQQIDGRPVTNDSTSTEPAKANINRSRSNIKQQIDGRPVTNDSTSTEPAKANINKSRSNIKQQIDGRPVTNDSTSTEPAKANINRSRSNIKQQIDGRPVTNDSTITEPAKANINKSRSNIKQQIDGKPVTNDSTSTEPAKADINRSRSNIKQQIDGRPVTNDSTSTEPAKANINRSRSNIKQQIDGRPDTNDSTSTEPAKANINKSRSNIKQQIDGRPVTNDSTSTEPAKTKKSSNGLATGRRQHTPVKLTENNQDSSANPAKANINRSRSNIKQQIDGRPVTNDSTSTEPAKAIIKKNKIKK